jgi:hypothetical protein
VFTRVQEARQLFVESQGDQIEPSDAHIQDEIEFALLQRRVETLTRISEALVRSQKR